MPNCPKCKKPYREGTDCPHCGFRPNTKESEDILPDNNSAQPEKLITVESETAFYIIKAKLAQYGIPAMMRHHPFGDGMQVLTGITFFGIDVFVPAEKLALAQSLLKKE